MRLLFLSAYYPPRTRGGAEVSTALLVEALQQRGHEVTVITSEAQLPFMSKPLRERHWSRYLAHRLARRVRPEDYDIVHAHDFRTALVLSELGWRNAVVTHRDYAAICGTTNEFLASGQPGDCCTWPHLLTNNPRVREAALLRKPFRIWQYKWNLAYRREAFLSFPAHVFISKTQQEVISRRVDLGSKKTAVIYNPVANVYLTAAPVQGQLGNVLYVGRVELYKGVRLLLEAWRYVVKKYSGAQLKIIGEGAQAVEYQRLVERWGLRYSVTFEKRVPHNRLQRVYDAATIVVAPHLWVEPFGRTVAEAMARGKVVVAANSGGPTEIIQHEKTGFLFERGSREALVAQLTAALALPDPKRYLIGSAAREWIRQHLTPNIIAEQYERFYQEHVLASGPAAKRAGWNQGRG